MGFTTRDFLEQTERQLFSACRNSQSLGDDKVVFGSFRGLVCLILFGGLFVAMTWFGFTLRVGGVVSWLFLVGSFTCQKAFHEKPCKAKGRRVFWASFFKVRTVLRAMRGHCSSPGTLPGAQTLRTAA